MRTADKFVGDLNARRTLIRLGERVPDSLDHDAVYRRYCIGVRAASSAAGVLAFVDGSQAERLIDGSWKVTR